MEYRSRLRRACAAAALAGVALGAAGCGGSGGEAVAGAVVLPAAQDVPGPADPGPGDVVAKAPPALRACLTRNDGVREAGFWPRRRHAAKARIRGAVDRRLGVRVPGADEQMRRGLISFRTAADRVTIFVALDPAVVDVTAFRRWVPGIARRANAAAGVRGTPVRVVVQQGCFPAATYLRADHALWEPGVGTSMTEPEPGLDGRIVAGFCPADRAEGQAAQRRFGPIVKVVEECVRSV